MTWFNPESDNEKILNDYVNLRIEFHEAQKDYQNTVRLKPDDLRSQTMKLRVMKAIETRIESFYKEVKTLYKI